MIGGKLKKPMVLHVGNLSGKCQTNVRKESWWGWASCRTFEAKTKTIEVFLPPQKSEGKILEGELADQVKELVSLLHNDAKVI